MVSGAAEVPDRQSDVWMVLLFSSLKFFCLSVIVPRQGKNGICGERRQFVSCHSHTWTHVFLPRCGVNDSDDGMLSAARESTIRRWPLADRAGRIPGSIPTTPCKLVVVCEEKMCGRRQATQATTTTRAERVCLSVCPAVAHPCATTCSDIS